MQRTSMQPKSYIFLSMLRCCVAARNVGKGQELHNDIVKYGLDGDSFLGSTLIDMYGKCGFIFEACHQFHRLEIRDMVAWTILIDVLAENGLSKQAERYFKLMQLEGVPVDANSFVCALKASGLEAGKYLHAAIMKRGFERQMYVAQSLVMMYCKADLHAEALLCFKLCERNVISWTALITACVDHGLEAEALSCFSQMEVEGISPVAPTFLGGLKACALLGALESGRKMHIEISKMGFEADLFITTALLDMYSKCSLLLEAQCVFAKLHACSVISWNALMVGFLEHGFGEKTLDCFKQLQVLGIAPVATTFACSLKACSMTKDLEMGHEIHATIVKRGLEREMEVINAVNDMYCKCYALAEAQNVFDQMEVRSVVAWTAMITSYGESALFEELRKSFQQMQVEEIFVDTVICVSFLKASGCVGAIDVGQGIHSEVIKKGLQNEVWLNNALVEMYMKCGLLAEAHEVFVTIQFPNAASWTFFIGGYVKYGFMQEALNTFEQLQLKGNPIPTEALFSCALKACGSLKDLERGWKVYGQLVKNGLEHELEVSNMLVELHSKCGAYLEAKTLFDRLLVGKSVSSWEALITGYIENGLGEETLECFKIMQETDILSNVNTYICALKACVMVGVLKKGQELHAELTKRGMEIDPYVNSSLLDMYVKCNALLDAQQVFNLLQTRNEISFNTLIAGYANHGFSKEALDCFKKMQHECVSPVPITFTCCLKACLSFGAVETGREIHNLMVKVGLEKDTFAGSSVAYLYAKFGSILDAKIVVNSLPAADVITWNGMLKALGECCASNVIVQCFEDMQQWGMKPTANTFLCLLAACSHANMVHEGLAFFEMKNEMSDTKPSICHYTCVIDLLARCGHLCDAEKLAASVQCFELVEVLRALLNACKAYAEVEVGERCFRQLILLKEADAAAYSLMADIYVSAGMWNNVNQVEEISEHAGFNRCKQIIVWT